MNMYCNNCGKEIPIGSNYCNHCGCKVSSSGSKVGRFLKSLKPNTKGKKITCGVVTTLILLIIAFFVYRSVSFCGVWRCDFYDYGEYSFSWFYDIKRDGTFTRMYGKYMSSEKEVEAAGTWERKGNTIIFNQTSGFVICGSMERVGVNKMVSTSGIGDDVTIYEYVRIEK